MRGNPTSKLTKKSKERYRPNIGSVLPNLAQIFPLRTYWFQRNSTSILPSEFVPTSVNGGASQTHIDQSLRAWTQNLRDQNLRDRLVRRWRLNPKNLESFSAFCLKS